MRTILISILLASSAFSQGMYLPNVNGISAGFLYGQYGYQSDNKLGFTATYTLFGVVDFSYSHSSVLTEEDVRNFQNDYLIRGYLLKENRFFISGSIGYQYQEIESVLWKDFPLSFKNEGISYELGLHLATTDLTDRKIVISIFYKHFAPTMEMRTPTVRVINSDLSRVFTFDLAVIFYFGQLGIEVGPRLVLENDFNYPFMGVDLSLMLLH